MGTLADRLTRIQAAFAKQAPAEALSVVQRAQAELDSTDILERIPSVGDTLPAFDLPDSQGGRVSSDALLAKGPLVLTVYRGVW